MAQVPVTNRAGEIVAYALVDNEDLHLVADKRWHLTDGYAAHSEWDPATKRTRRVKMHRLILGLPPRRPFVDHRNRNRLDNQRENLRPCTPQQNKLNGNPYKSKRGSTRYRGVWWREERKRWVAEHYINGKAYRIGSFRSEDEAGEAARAWRATHMPFAEG